MRRILVVDNDRTFQDFVKQVFPRALYRVDAVGQGGQALKVLSTRGADVMITEAHLPDMPAWELVPEAHRIDPHLPVVVATGDDSWETSKRTRIEGGPVFFYGLKPMDAQELGQVIYYALRWRQHLRSGMRVSSSEGIYEV